MSLCDLFNDAVSSSECKALIDGMITDFNELGRMWKEAVMAPSDKLPWCLPQRDKEENTMKKFLGWN